MWKGTIVSQRGVAASAGMVVKRHASPMDVPSTSVRDAGQIGARPSMRTLHKVGRGTIGTDAACVEGWEMRKSVDVRI